MLSAVAILTLENEHLRDLKWVVSVIGITFLLAILYLIPLHVVFDISSLGTSLPANIIDKVNIAGEPSIMAVTANGAWNSLFFLFAPTAILLFAANMNRDDLRFSIPVLIGLGTISGIFGVLQLAGGINSIFYFYDITNNGSAVGLFANRNHAAVFLACVFPMLAVFSTTSSAISSRARRSMQLVAAAIAIFLVPLILVTGSRSGMLAALIGLVGGMIIYYSRTAPGQKSTTSKSLKPVIAIAILLGLIFATIFFSRAEAISRFFGEQTIVDDRTEFWIASLPMFWQYFPFGFGSGGFASAFQVVEPLELLNGEYLNRLHNDWLEIALTYGALGAILMAAGTICYLRRTFTLWVQMDGNRTAVALGRMASVNIAILAVASVSDYPLRTPAMAGFAALSLVWFMHASRKPV